MSTNCKLPTQSFTLPIQAPFDWQSLLAFLRLRATPGVETVTDSAYLRTAGEGPTLHRVSVSHDPANSVMQVNYTGPARDRSGIEQRVRQLFKPDVNTGEIEMSLARDRWLKRFVIRQPGLRVPGGWCGFEVAMRAILGQQISVAAATTLMGRLVRMAGARVNESDWIFPSPEQVLTADLSGLGIPGKRRETVKSLAAFFAGQNDECLLRADAMERLLAINGIGRWTAGYILMRTSDTHDFWPEGDLVLRKALGKNKVLVTPSALAQAFSRWTPYRSYAAIHIWRGYVSSANAARVDSYDDAK
ncbi:MAG: AlkA N-terminal domain-containing protein [Candidatus Angelobacter sp.]